MLFSRFVTYAPSGFLLRELALKNELTFLHA
jgi:hypothetical protein